MPPERQDKRTVIPLDRGAIDVWLHGTPDEAAALVKLPAMSLFRHEAADPAQQVDLPVETPREPPR